MAEREPALAGFVHATILKHDRLENALSYHLATQAGRRGSRPAAGARDLRGGAWPPIPSIGAAVRADLSAVFERDPACHSFVEAFLYYKGFHALECYRIAHWLWRQDRKRHGAVLPEPHLRNCSRWTSIPPPGWAAAS